MYTQFQIGFNFKMDHMRISGDEPSSVILCRTKWFQRLKIMNWKGLTSWSQKGWCKIKILIDFNTENFDALKRYKSTEDDRRIWLHVHVDSLVHQQWHSSSSWNIKRDFY